jgi:hypothetical protein
MPRQEIPPEQWTQLEDTLIEVLAAPDPLSGSLRDDMYVQYLASYPVPGLWVPYPTRRFAMRPIATTRLFMPDERRPYDTEEFLRPDTEENR